mmetsp:Transcript_14431/g.24621  ORF Transcript_14431/g.24621 Transcript_14431/m.24621 type:complete len:83 (-) Transcript_14431:89-337(-)
MSFNERMAAFKFRKELAEKRRYKPETIEKVDEELLKIDDDTVKELVDEGIVDPKGHLFDVKRNFYSKKDDFMNKKHDFYFRI